VLIAPINGRDFFRAHVRHIVGNMTYAEAAELAATLGVDLVIPCHFGQHDVNTEDPGRFVDHLARRHRRLRHRILVPGEGMIYHPRLTVG
jgi:L-ascorbate 6-phosphate lactonase